jgi:hypothetical protein
MLQNAKRRNKKVKNAQNREKQATEAACTKLGRQTAASGRQKKCRRRMHASSRQAAPSS